MQEKEEEEKQSSGKAAQTNRIKSSDYHSWDKFDVEKECAKAEKDEEGKKKEKSEVSNSNCQPLDVKLSERGNQLDIKSRWNNFIMSSIRTQYVCCGEGKAGTEREE